jgi:hypothetical protein
MLGNSLSRNFLTLGRNRLNLTDLHRRLLEDILDAGGPFGLVITGGYAVQAHGLVDRRSRDLDVATQSPDRMEAIVSALVEDLSARGWQVRKIETDPISARLIITDPATAEACEVDVLKEAFYHPPKMTQYGPVLSLDDVIGTKVRALADRGAPRDLIDVHAASSLHTSSDLENLGKRHARDEFRIEDLAARLDGAEWFEDEAFSAYGLNDEQITTLRAWARSWSDDISSRLAEQPSEDDLPLPASPFLGEELKGAQPVGVVVGDRRDDELVGADGVTQRLELVGDLGG